MHTLGKYIIIAGLIVVAIGIIVYLLPKEFPLGKLPGDIRIKRDNFTFYFPLATSILLSLVLTLVLWVIRYFSNK